MTSLVISENVLKIYLIAYFFVLVNFVFVATFVIKIKKKREKSGKQIKLVTLASIVRCAIHVVRTIPILELLPPPPPPKIFLMAPNAINVGGSNK